MASNELVPASPDDPSLPPPRRLSPVAPSQAVVSQVGNTVHGDMAAGNIQKIYQAPRHPSAAHMARLIAQYKAEIAADPVLHRTIEKLHHYADQATHDLRDVAQKLQNGGREKQIPEALELKENAAKVLMRHQTSEAAQLIHAIVLGHLTTQFAQNVHPNIAKEDAAAIDARVCAVINDTVAMLDENPLNLTSEDLRAFLFLLTGNCHIKWD